jgi:hypothetical protein
MKAHNMQYLLVLLQNTTTSVLIVYLYNNKRSLEFVLLSVS